MLDLTEPAVLFPAVSLLLLAYTNRFLAIASLIRQLHQRLQVSPSAVVLEQIRSLRKRVLLIRNMQAFGIGSLFLCVACMFLIFSGQFEPAEWVFGISLLSLLISLGLSFREIQISTYAIKLELSNIEGLQR